MPIRIPVPNTSYATQIVSLGGESYEFTFRYNERSERWKLDIVTTDGVVVRNGITLVEGLFFTEHLVLPEFDHGALGVVQLEIATQKASRHNLGIGRQYELVYVSNDEREI
jgi:hypothetical protein